MQSTTFAQRLVRAIELSGIKPAEISKISKQLFLEKKIPKAIEKPTLSAYLQGKYEAKQDNIYTLAKILNVSEAWLMGHDVPMRKNISKEYSNVTPIPDTPTPLPVLGKISAGLPLLAVEDIIGYDFAPSSELKKDYEYFYLIVNGDSMNLKFKNGDRLLIQKQDTLENGEIGVIMVNGDDATVKKFRTENNLIVLEPMSTNPEHHTQIYNPKETPIKIIGKVILYIGNV